MEERKRSRFTMSLLEANPQLAAEWDYAKNGDLKPSDVARASSRKVYWKCSLGHSWQTTVSSRAYGSRCPYCSGRKAWPGFNDLQTLNPILASEWDGKKNGKLKPTAVTRFSSKVVKWKCRCGEGLEKSVGARSRGSRCRTCSTTTSGFINFGSLSEGCPELVAEWHPTLNETLTPNDVDCVSRKLVWWRCPSGHDYRASVGRRFYGMECPECKQSRKRKPLAEDRPDLLAQWDHEKNEGMSPEEILITSHAPVYWTCENGHSYSLPPYMRVAGAGCPFCATKARSLATAYPALAAQWHPTKNGALTPEEVDCRSTQRVWWIYTYRNPMTNESYVIEWEESVAARRESPTIKHPSGMSKEDVKILNNKMLRIRDKEDTPEESAFWNSAVEEDAGVISILAPASSIPEELFF